MAIKLIDACKQLNVNMSVVWHYCKQHGIDIVIDPGALIDDNLYLSLVNELKKEPEIFTLPKPVLKNAPKVLGRIDLSEFDKKGISINKSIKNSEITSRESAFQANDTELVKYLLKFWGVEKLEFEGIYTTENIDLTKVRGLVTNVTISGKHVVFPFTNADFNRISVRKGGELKNTLVPGRCSFLCKLAPLEVRKKRNEPFLLTIDLNTIHNINEVREVAQGMTSETSAINHSPKHMTNFEQIIRERLNPEYSCLIGRLITEQEFKEGGSPSRFVITDIRGGEGEELEESWGISSESYFIDYTGTPKKTNEFYMFEWHIDPSTNKIQIDGELKEIDKPEFLQRLFLIQGRKRGGDLKESFRIQEMVFSETTGAEHTYIYELLQNANDYPHLNEKVKVKFILTNNYLFFYHTGAEFDLKNIVAICSVNNGNKKNKKNAIGYKGIGFKTVFAAQNNYVYLSTGDWSLRFDEKYSRDYKHGDCAWSMMPIATCLSELDSECNEQILNTSNDFRVKFALKHKVDASLNRPQLDKVFSDGRILLFIPNVDIVDVCTENNGKLEPLYHVTKQSENWDVSHFSFKVDDDLKKIIANELKKGGKIPPKFQDISDVNISFAVYKDKNKLIKLSEGDVIFNYLPTELSLGLGFLINADFIPDASRKGLHPVKWNREVMTQCGRYFVTKCWQQFIENESKYDLVSAFDIIPDFNTNDVYAKCFELGFNEKIVETNCIPTKKDEIYRCCKISEIIWDKIGLTDPDNPILTDEEFYKFVTSNYYLPHKSIRKHNKLKALFENEKCKELPQLFSDSGLLSLCTNEDFKNWLKIEENNIRFLKFVIEKNYFSNLSNYPIFLSVSGELKRASELYIEDVDKYVNDLAFLGEKLPRLNLNVRNDLEKIYNWANCKTQFKKFYDFQFARDILNDVSLKSTLYTFENSISFLHFLAIIDYSGAIPNDYPIYNEQGEQKQSNDWVYFKHSEGVEFLKKSWTDAAWASFLHSAYFNIDADKVKVYIIKKFGISELDNNRCCISFVENEKYAQLIASKINGNIIVSLDFYLFLSKIKNHEIKFNDNVKQLYKILTEDAKGMTYWCPISALILKQNENWKSVAKASWMPSGICIALSNNYAQFTTASSWEELQSFLENSKFISSLGIKGLYDRVIFKHSDEIFAYIQTKEQSKDFLKYLYDFKQTFFGENMPDVKYKNIPIFCDGNIVSNAFSKSLYSHSDELDTLVGQEWFDQTTISVCDSYYNDLFDGQDRTKFYQSLGLLQFNLKNYILSQILPKINAYCETLQDRGNNISFHKYFASIHNLFTVDELAPLKNTPIYLQSPIKEEGELVLNSNDHYLPTALLNEIISNDLVPISIMDALHPDYISANVEKDYYVGKLQNTEIELGGFINYITSDDNKSEVYNYISEKERNIRFWRWVLTTNGIKYEMKEILACFSLLSNNDTDFCKPSELYISDNYVWDGFEDFIKEFEPDAKFVSALYLDDTTDKNEWRALFKNIKVTVDTSDLVANVLLPNLDKYNQVSVVKVLAEYTDKFKVRLNDEKDELRNQLSKLPLKCADDNYYIPSDALISGAYYNIDNNPMEMVVLPNLVSEEYLNGSHDENEKIKLFLRLIADNFNCKIDTETALFNEKVSYFLNHQNDYIDTSSHYEIIAILSNNYVVNQYNYSIIDKEVILKTTSGKSCDASKLYLSSVYHPNCDYNGNGINDTDFGLQFVSAEYAQHSQHAESFFKNVLSVHHDFDQSNLNTLENLEFSQYFWNTFTHEKGNDLSHLCNEDNLSKLSCIPTIKGLKRPKDVYDYRNETLCKIVQKMVGNESTDLLPCVQFPSWLDKIGMRHKLHILDCLKYLKLEILDNRTKVITWLSETPLEVVMKYQDEITEFSQSTRWLNGKREWVQLSSLVAISRNSKSLYDYFHANGSVCLIPELTIEQFSLLCKEILKVKILTDADFSKEHDEGAVLDKQAKVDFKKRLLYILYTSGKKNWEDLYKENLVKIDNADIRSCKQIFYKYNDDIQTNVKVYSESPEYLWYVGSWNAAMYGNVKEWLKTYVEPFKEVSRDFLDNILLDDFQIILKNYESELSAEFSKYLDETELKDMKVVSDEDESYSEDIDATVNNPMARKTTTQIPNDKNYEPNTTGYNESRNIENRTISDETKSTENIKVEQSEQEPKYLSKDQANNSNDHTQEPFGKLETTEKAPQQLDDNPDKIVEIDSDNSGDIELEHISKAHAGTYYGSDEPEDDNPISNTPRRPHRPSSPSAEKRSGTSSSPYKPYIPDPEGVQSSGMPIQLETAQWTQAEEADLRRILNGRSSEDIANDAYLANYRLLKQIEKWKEEHPEYDIELEESDVDFILNIPKKGGVIADHKLKSGKFIRSCSAASGVLYLSPGVWNLVADERCMLCIYRGTEKGKVANEFKLIRSYSELIEFIGMDDLVIKLTGRYRVKLIEFLYNNIRSKVTRGTVYSLIRVGETTPIDSITAPLPSAMTEQEDEDSKFY